MDETANVVVVTMGCKKWTGGDQRGLRIYVPTIRDLTAVLNVPSEDGKWPSLADFIDKVQTGAAVTRYSRRVEIVREDFPNLAATMTIYKHGRTTQGYITAPKGTWLYRFVSRRLNTDLAFKYAATPDGDVLVVPSRSAVGQTPDLNAEANRMKKEIERSLQRENRPPPPDAKAIGLCFEQKEVERIRSEGLTPRHRYPSIRSGIPSLLSANISCDIDVVRPDGRFHKCVEVKAVAGPTGGESVRKRAAEAYHRYQNCGIKGAMNLFATGW